MSPLSDGATFDSAARRSGPATRRRSTPTCHAASRPRPTVEPLVHPSDAVAPANPIFPASTGGNGVVHSTPPTGRRATPGPPAGNRVGNGMMSIDMDHSAPQRRSAGSPVSAPRIDGPPRGTRPRPARRRQFAAPRRLAAGVLAGALTMLVAAPLDTVTGRRCRCSGRSPRCRRRRRQPEVVELARPARHPGHVPELDARGRVRHPRRRLHAGPPVRAGRHRAPGRPDASCPTTGRGASSSASAATRSSSST